jgi:hypothetical protein
MKDFFLGNISSSSLGFRVEAVGLAVWVIEDL